MFSELKNYSFVQEILSHFGEIYVVGGSVRDHFMSRPTKDLDIIVRLLPIDKLTHILKKCGRYNLVGKAFGVIKFYPKENKEREIDIALPRTEISTGSGHKDFSIQSNPHLDIKEDLKRRDFTINAIAVCLKTDAIIDPFDGQTHIKQKTIATVFKSSFLEDPLRMLRAIQFATRFDFEIEPDTLAEMKQHANLIKTISAERIILEIKKLFTAPIPSIGFNMMRETGLLPLVFPDISKMIGIRQPKKENEDVFDHTMRVLNAARDSVELDHPGNINLMFAALFHDSGKPKTRRENRETGDVSFYNHNIVSAGIAGRWLKNHKAQTIGVNIKTVCHLIKNHMFETRHFLDNEKALRRFITKVGKEHIFDLIDLRLADKKGGRFPKKLYGVLKLRDYIIEEVNKKPPFTPKDLAINGHDLMQIGFKPGPVIGEIQRFLMEKVLDEPELNTKETLLAIVEENKESF